MTGLEEFAAVAVLGWFIALVVSQVRLVRAQTPQEHDSAVRALSACVIGGLIVVIAPSVGMWITGLKTFKSNEGETIYYYGEHIEDGTNPSDPSVSDRCLPAGTGHVIDLVISLFRIVGGLVVVLGLIGGGIRLRAAPFAR